MQNVTLQQRTRRLARIRATIRGTALRPRLAVKASLQHLYVQVIDDASGRTLAAARDGELSAEARQGKTKTERAAALGVLIAERAKAKGVTQVVFDRRDKRYHGRIRALAEGARQAGLIF